MKKYIKNLTIGFVLLFFTAEKMAAQNNLPRPEIRDSLNRESISLGFVTLNPSQIIGAVTILNADDIRKFDKRNTVYDALQSRVSGFVSEIRSGSLVSEPTIRGSKINFIIDGMKGDPKYIQLQQVEKIVVLKDAMSRMAFGDKSLEMIVVITTKRGLDSGKNKISANFEYGIDVPKSYPKYLNSFDYASLYNEAQLNDDPTAINRYNSTQLEGYRGADRVRYPDLEFYNSTFLKDYKSSGKLFIDSRGGGKNTKYYMSLIGSVNNSLLNIGEGKNEGAQNYSFRANIDSKITSKIKVCLDIASFFGFNRYAGEPDVQESNFFYHASKVRPNEYPLFIPQDILNGTQSISLIGTAKVIDNNLLGGTNLFQKNIFGELYFRGYAEEVKRNTRFNFSMDFNLDNILSGLRMTTGMSFDLFADQYYKLRNKYAVYMPKYDANNLFYGVTRQTDADEFSATRSTFNLTNVIPFYRRLNFYSSLNWIRSIKDHSFTANLIGYGEKYTMQGVAIEDNNVYFGLNTVYAYKGKYMAQFSGNYMGSQILPQSDMFRFSPSIGMAWVISKEQFMENSTLVDHLKLRASWGNLMSDHPFKTSNVGLYKAAFTLFNTGGSAYATGGKTGTLSMNSTTYNQIGNPGIDLFQREEFNIGFDATLFNNTLDATLNLYQQSDKGNPTQVANRTADYLGGLNSYRNFGETRERSMEMGLSYSKQAGEFKYTVGANFLTVFNTTILQIDEPLYQNPGLQSQVGRSVSGIYGYVFDGFYKDQADIDNANPLNKINIRPGDLKYKDLDENGIIDSNDGTEIGKSRPTVVSALNFTLSYKGFDLFACMTSSLGSDIMLWQLNSNYYIITGEKKYPAYLMDGRWTPQTAETATFPRLSVSQSGNNYQSSTFWLRKNNRVDLAAIQLSYTVPDQMFGSRGIVSGCQVYLRGNDLITVSPIADDLNLSVGSEPQYRSFTLGLNFNF